VVTVPLILLAIPSLAIGYFTVEPLLFGGALADSIFVREANDVVANNLAGKFDHGVLAFALHGFLTPVFWLAMLGVGISTYVYLFNPGLAESMKQRFHAVWKLLDNKYGFDDLYQKILAGAGLGIASGLSRGGDRTVIDGWLVNGSARMVGRMSGALRQLQSGFLFHYAFVMVVALVALVASFVLLR
jgi:NADH-quinone oxidoreductase subunit L